MRSWCIPNPSWWHSWFRYLGTLCVMLCLVPLGTHAEAPVGAEPIRVFIVGGGPDEQNNQVAIESNVRYVGRLLPPGTVRTTLFADGNPNRATVLFDPQSRSVSVGEQLLDLVLDESDSDAGSSHLRKPNLGGTLDGASKNADIRRVFTSIASEANAQPGRPLLLYFTGHGSSNDANQENNVYDLWGDHEALSVHALAGQIAKLPEQMPVTVVMVQCFSGAFGNLIFEAGDPQGKPVDRDFAGFFATVKERVAAGCTSAVNEADYHDFTSYFFAALTGRDRIGRTVTGADYNNDGRVGMNEAFCYTLAHDDSIDVPVCTSDVFLRRFVHMEDAEVMRVPYHNVRAWATPAQAAALDVMEEKLKLTGENRLAIAYKQAFSAGDNSGRTYLHETQLERQLTQRREEGRLALFRRWPDLRLSEKSQARRARIEAAKYLNERSDQSPWKEIADANTALNEAQMNDEKQEIARSYVLRFVRLGKSIVLAHRLQETGTPEIKARFERLIADEGRTPLPPVERLATAGHSRTNSEAR